MTVILEFILSLEEISFPPTFVGVLHKNKLKGKEQHMQEVHIREFCTFLVCVVSASERECECLASTVEKT